MALTQTAASRQYVTVVLESVRSALTGEDVTPTMLRMAVTPVGEVPNAATVWRTVVAVQADDGTQRVGWLRTKDSIPPGTYTVWLEVTAGDENPPVNTGVLILQ